MYGIPVLIGLAIWNFGACMLSAWDTERHTADGSETIQVLSRLPGVRLAVVFNFLPLFFTWVLLVFLPKSCIFFFVQGCWFCNHLLEWQLSLHRRGLSVDLVRSEAGYIIIIHEHTPSAYFNILTQAPTLQPNHFSSRSLHHLT